MLPLILNALNYEYNNKITTKIEFVIADMQDSKNFKGLTPIRSYYNGKDNFNKINTDMIGIPLDAVFEEKPNYNNPLEIKRILKEFRYNNDVINLL